MGQTSLSTKTVSVFSRKTDYTTNNQEAYNSAGDELEGDLAMEAGVGEGDIPAGDSSLGSIASSSFPMYYKKMLL